MTIHEFGKENSKMIVLVHPPVVMWDYFKYVIPYLEGKYHLVICDYWVVGDKITNAK